MKRKDEKIERVERYLYLISESLQFEGFIVRAQLRVPSL